MFHRSPEFLDDTLRHRNVRGYIDNLRAVLSTLGLGNEVRRYPVRELDKPLYGELCGSKECMFLPEYALCYKVLDGDVFLIRAAPYRDIWDFPKE
ncbi:hypothetical protein FACS1894217_15770 [Clostridia bacterium]|nr:hypothetical protein FACS1894217_15770 [Clostridia bacterium]